MISQWLDTVSEILNMAIHAMLCVNCIRLSSREESGIHRRVEVVQSASDGGSKGFPVPGLTCSLFSSV